MRTTIALLIGLVGAAVIGARGKGDLSVGEARATEPAVACTLISGAKVYLPGAIAAEVDVVLANGRVRAVGAGIDVASCTRVDGRGQVLTAGFIDANTGLGLVEVDLEGSTVDTDLKNVHQDPAGAVRAAVRASLGYNPRSITIRVARTGGVTSALVVPTNGIISGGAFWVDLAGETRAVIKREPAAMAADISALSESRAAGMHVIDVALKEAALWEKERGAWLKNQRAGFANKTLDLEALGPVVRGEVPLLVTVDRASDIEALLALTEGTKVRLVLVGAAEGWLVKEALAARGVAVIVDPILYGPGGFDQLRARSDNAPLCAAAGVKVLLSTFNSHQVRRLRQVAGNAVRGGLPWQSALLAVTEWAADAFGMSGHGRIAAGAVGNVVLWSGDPFELATRVVKVWIDGREVNLRTRQTELFERWRTQPQ